MQIIPILVPFMPLDRMKTLASQLADAIDVIAKEQQWTWGKDFAIVISSDAVHYGDEDWGGKNYAPFGTGDQGYTKAVAKENDLISTCLAGPLTAAKIDSFSFATVDRKNYKDYLWTWCGRYSVPFGLFTSYYLAKKLQLNLQGIEIGYSTSLEKEPLKVNDLRMGVTAPANKRHWVGYPAIGYR